MLKIAGASPPLARGHAGTLLGRNVRHYRANMPAFLHSQAHRGFWRFVSVLSAAQAANVALDSDAVAHRPSTGKGRPWPALPLRAGFVSQDLTLGARHKLTEGPSPA